MEILQPLIFLAILILTKQLEVKDETATQRPLGGLGGLGNCSGPCSRLEENPVRRDERRNSDYFFTNRKSSGSVWVHLNNQLSSAFLTPVNKTSDEGQREAGRTDPQDEADPVSRTPRAAPSPDDPLVQFDQQQIVMLADDEVVRTAAASLYHKHPAVSSLHAVRRQHRVRQVKGQAAPLSERSSLVLVGHGAREPSGEMRISGYSYQDVARIIQSSSRIGQKIQTTAVVACGAGSDRRFPQALLQTLHRAGLETELHLWETAVQVAETGDVLSQDGARWRSGDHSKKLVLTVGRTGEIRRRDDRRHCTGQEVDSTDRGILGKGGKDGGKQKDKKRGEEEEGDSEEQISIYRRSFPDKPQRFINVDVYKQIDQNVETVKKAFWELESVTWGLFYSKPELQKVDVDHDQINGGFTFILRKKTPGNNRWINDQNELRKHLDACYVIRSGSDIRNIIRYFADHGEDKITYLMVNDWIFEVNLKDLYVYPAGKRLTAEENKENKDQIKAWIDLRDRGIESYQGIKSNIPDEGKKTYVFYVKCIFGLQTLKQNPSKTEMFLTWYFTASVISESARNFRTFPLTLMALDMSDKDILFNRHPMAYGGTWIDPQKRGFEGAAEGDSEKLKEVLGREYAIFKQWAEAKKKYDSKESLLYFTAALIAEYEIFPDDKKFMEGYNDFKAKTKM
ncbi:uncharacterized protein LOC108166567 [Poecilia reticulata]|uniref:uncharacterized protein LOC108166567 n=1 Tax=Poecilia reticulata TaxID=8081 RepID=UPI0007E973CE|nr:PREDICTED: uncharacterized protein LOC108166567 [Poecilia reticulata]